MVGAAAPTATADATHKPPARSAASRESAGITVAAMGPASSVPTRPSTCRFTTRGALTSGACAVPAPTFFAAACVPGACVPGACTPGACVPGACTPGACASPLVASPAFLRSAACAPTRATRKGSLSKANHVSYCLTTVAMKITSSPTSSSGGAAHVTVSEVSPTVCSPVCVTRPLQSGCDCVASVKSSNSPITSPEDGSTAYRLRPL
mmetsp:Transcript_6576/g.26812  ORF Transcript_6576/g.26812 Transcript_6576/m.26812 type:complete len:208 (+) Transcript_6576:3357-3980(+)